MCKYYYHPCHNKGQCPEDRRDRAFKSKDGRIYLLDDINWCDKQLQRTDGGGWWQPREGNPVFPRKPAEDLTDARCPQQKFIRLESKEKHPEIWHSCEYCVEEGEKLKPTDAMIHKEQIIVKEINGRRDKLKAQVEEEERKQKRKAGSTGRGRTEFEGERVLCSESSAPIIYEGDAQYDHYFQGPRDSRSQERRDQRSRSSGPAIHTPSPDPVTARHSPAPQSSSSKGKQPVGGYSLGSRDERRSNKDRRRSQNPQASQSRQPEPQVLIKSLEEMEIQDLPDLPSFNDEIDNILQIHDVESPGPSRSSSSNRLSIGSAHTFTSLEALDFDFTLFPDPPSREHSPARTVTSESSTATPRPGDHAPEG